MNINVIYDSSVSSAPTAFKTAIAAVVQYLDAEFTNPITVNIDVGYGEIAGQSMGTGALGESETYYNNYSYAQVRNALVQNATSADQKSAVAASLPATDPTGGGTYWVATANAKARSASRARAARSTAMSGSLAAFRSPTTTAAVSRPAPTISSASSPMSSPR